MKIFLSFILILAFILCAVSCSSDSGAMYESPSKNEIISDNEASLDKSDHDKIIKTVTAYGETKEYDKAVGKIKALITEYGGYIENSNVYGNSYDQKSFRRASFTVRIPAGNIEAFSNEVEKTVNLTSVSENMTNVSDEYYDIEAIIETLSAERQGLLNILKSIESSAQYDYWLKITERLSSIEKDIAIYTARLKQLDNKVDYSTYCLTLNEVSDLTVPAPATFGERIADAFSESWEDFYNNTQDLAVFLVSALPTLIILGCIGGVIAWIVIANDKKKPKK